MVNLEKRGIELMVGLEVPRRFKIWDDSNKRLYQNTGHEAKNRRETGTGNPTSSNGSRSFEGENDRGITTLGGEDVVLNLPANNIVST